MKFCSQNSVMNYTLAQNISQFFLISPELLTAVSDTVKDNRNMNLYSFIYVIYEHSDAVN